MKKIAIYGGSFSPPHVGHGIVVENLQRLFPCDEIWVMPSADRYDKKMTAAAEHRLKMLEIMVGELFPTAKIPIVISPLEVQNLGLTTTHRTFMELRKLYPEDKLYLVVGSDIFYDIESRWIEGKELFKLGNFIVIQRLGSFLPDKKGDNVNVLSGEVATFNISSTFVRKLLRQGHEACPYITRGVADYIKNNGLYTDSSSVAAATSN